ncbi:DUF4942 domain-containing protein [Rhodococcus qingshengii]|uniref:DUF4942 domain-containing protein n=1 Tax=Rhodococcus qingshengii TaxID=334542 RepID=UPI0029428582|nr:DUF4942 domain-containing protein [Rhodococcus qingshengii]WOI85962.1 DUF4942 domain-containing protein [Rhodococcus qingshengii]
MFNPDFYPTPPRLIATMIDKLDREGCKAILEPSAGRGDLAEGITNYAKNRDRWYGVTVDTIEVDDELAAILAAKGMKPIARDFLTFESYRHYDAVVMNPPFYTGAAHLLKALDLMKNGGQVVSLLNAETLRNPYTNERKELASKLESLGASIEYVEAAFETADRKTSVETAIVYVNIPRRVHSDILENLTRAKAQEANASATANDIVDGDELRGAVRRYEVEMEAGLALIREYEALKPYLTRSFDNKSSLLELRVNGREDSVVNDFVRLTRMKYWQQLFQTKTFAGAFTVKTREAYHQRVEELGAYEFNLANIKQMQADLSASMLETLDDAIVGLFDEFSSQYWNENSKNIHYYNGWRTNEAWRINKKVITRLNAYGWYNDQFDPAGISKVRECLADINKIFAYLDGRLVTDLERLDERLTEAGKSDQTKAVDFEYFTVDFYKKGTSHITFKRDDLLKKFNLIGSQRKGWLPPDYGSKQYHDMTPEARDVVDSFEGFVSYEDTRKRLDFYQSRAQLSLAG